jgi:alpha-mannosidase
MTKPIKKEIIGTIPFGLVISHNVGTFYKQNGKLYYSEVVPTSSFALQRSTQIWNEYMKETKREEKQKNKASLPFITPYDKRKLDF